MITKFNLFEKLSEKELNRILDKILDQGKKSLTDSEWRKLKANDDVELSKEELIDEIKDIVKKYSQYITIGELYAETDPVYKEEGQTIHIVNALMIKTVDIVIYGGYKYETVIDEYEETYDKLSYNTLKYIKYLLINAIEFEYITEDV